MNKQSAKNIQTHSSLQLTFSEEVVLHKEFFFFFFFFGVLRMCKAKTKAYLQDAAHSKSIKID